MFKAILICVVVLAVAAIIYFVNRKKNELVVTNRLVATPDIVYVNDEEREADIVVYSYRNYQRGKQSEIHVVSLSVTPVLPPFSLEKKSEFIDGGQYNYRLKLDKDWVFDENLEDGKELATIRFYNADDEIGRVVTVVYKKVVKLPSVKITLEKIVDENGEGNTFGLKVAIPEDMPHVYWSVTGSYKVADKGENDEYGDVQGKFTINGVGVDYEALTVSGINSLVYKGDGLFVSEGKLMGTMDKRKSKVTYGDTVSR